MSKAMKRAAWGVAIAVAGIALSAAAAEPTRRPAMGPNAAEKPTDVARGRYLALVGGCNDCHTSGFAPTGGKVTEDKWLLGEGVVGFRGPWGTTYAPNLRLVVAAKTEDDWVGFVRDLKTRPPMPWFTLNQWSQRDLRALYRFIRQLGPPGEATTAFLPPETAPKGPVIQWPAPPK